MNQKYLIQKIKVDEFQEFLHKTLTRGYLLAYEEAGVEGYNTSAHIDICCDCYGAFCAFLLPGHASIGTASDGAGYTIDSFNVEDFGLEYGDSEAAEYDCWDEWADQAIDSFVEQFDLQDVYCEIRGAMEW